MPIALRLLVLTWRGTLHLLELLGRGVWSFLLWALERIGRGMIWSLRELLKFSTKSWKHVIVAITLILGLSFYIFPDAALLGEMLQFWLTLLIMAAGFAIMVSPLFQKKKKKWDGKERRKKR